MVYYTHIPISSIRPSVRAWGAVSVSAGVGSAAAASTLPTPGGFAQKASPAEWKSNLRDGGNIDPLYVRWGIGIQDVFGTPRSDNSKTTDNPAKNWSTSWNRHFPADDIRGRRATRRCSSSLVVRGAAHCGDATAPHAVDHGHRRRKDESLREGVGTPSPAEQPAQTRVAAVRSFRKIQKRCFWTVSEGSGS